MTDKAAAPALRAQRKNRLNRRLAQELEVRSGPIESMPTREQVEVARRTSRQSYTTQAEDIIETRAHLTTS